MPGRQRLRGGIGDAAAVPRGAAAVDLGGIGQRRRARRAPRPDPAAAGGRGVLRRARRRPPARTAAWTRRSPGSARTSPTRPRPRARRLAESMAVALQGALLVRHGHPAVADAFAATRLAGRPGPCLRDPPVRRAGGRHHRPRDARVPVGGLVQWGHDDTEAPIGRVLRRLVRRQVGHAAGRRDHEPAPGPAAGRAGRHRARGWRSARSSTGLRLKPSDVLLDLACGRAWYGLEITARAGARLIGVDFSAEAVRQAAEQARLRNRDDAEFRTGDLTASGLPDRSVNAVLCTDSIQFPEEPEAAYRRTAPRPRARRPGGADQLGARRSGRTSGFPSGYAGSISARACARRASSTSRSWTARSGWHASWRCGRRRSRWTRTTIRPCAPSTTRGSARWRTPIRPLRRVDGVGDRTVAQGAGHGRYELRLVWLMQVLKTS